MASTSMPPPPSPLAHRRSRLITPHPQSDSRPCLPRKMSLTKGATFHSSSSPSTDADPVLSIPHLSRRSPTCSHASLASLLSEKRELAAQHILDFEQTFSGARGNSHRARRRSAHEFNQQLNKYQATILTDEGLGSSIGSPQSEKGISKSLARVDLQSNKDSGLGESVSGSVIGVPVITIKPEEDGHVADLIQETDSSEINALPTRRQGNPRRISQRTRTSQTTPRTAAVHPSLTHFAHSKINEHLIQPLLQEEQFKAFHPLVTKLGSKSNKNIRCLRDLEQGLIFQPLTRSLSVSASSYRSFGELTVQLVVDTFQHLSEDDQRRASDRPYTNGYFLDLVQQVNQLAAHIGASRQLSQGEIDQSIPSIDDEVTLEGGLGSTGEFAELVRWKNGKGVSLRTGLPYEPLPGIKRQHSSMSQEEIERSMARRKKGYIPEIIEMKCSDPTCDKVFNRKCDLAKHEKTHSRPFKCPIVTCKYHEQGLPTEKEKDRHMNDKHDPNPRLYRCTYCEFKTKRESNCKQHMEKKHGWEYKRAKGKDKDLTGTPSVTPQTPNLEYTPSMVQQSPAQPNYGYDDGSSVSGSLAGSTHFTPYDEPINTFDFNQGYSGALFPRQPSQPAQFVQATNDFAFQGPGFQAGFDQFNGYASPAQTTPASVNIRMTPVTPAYSAITSTSQSPYVNTSNLAVGNLNHQGWNDGLPTPESGAYSYHSRHASMQLESPVDMAAPVNKPLLDTPMEVPDEDFTLFGPFSNPAAANQTLFPGRQDMVAQDYHAGMFENLDFNMDMDLDMLNAGMDDFVNFSAN